MCVHTSLRCFQVCCNSRLFAGHKVSILKQVACYLCRNADISNTYKLDLRALRVEQALEQIEKTINDLSSFKCKSFTCPALLCNTQM